MKAKAKLKEFISYSDKVVWEPKMLKPTPDSISDFLTENVRAYFHNPSLLDPNMGVKSKVKSKKRERHLTPPQRATIDYGGRWEMEEDTLIYYWGEVRLHFDMKDMSFRRL